MPRAQTTLRPLSRRLGVAMLVLACALAVALVTGPKSRAQSEQLDQVRAEQDQIRDRLAQQNAAIDDLLGQVGALREREDKVAAELAAQEAKLAAARTELATAREDLAQAKRQLAAATEELEALLVRIYRYGEPDEVTILLQADGLDELAVTSTYLDRIRDYQTGVVDRVRGLRADAAKYVEQIEGSVARMETARDAIADRQDALAASRASLEAQEAELDVAQAERREDLNKLRGQEKSLVEALQAPTPAPATGDAPSPPPPVQNVPAPNGSTASINSDGTATAPADAPQAVKDVIAAGNQITNTPYVYGGGHGSFESSGYDCSGSVSYALHGGGFLASPLDSTGFMTWGDSGPGQWITVYSNPGHAYMVVAGIRFDTSGAPPRWQASMRDNVGYVAAHPSGY